MTESEVKLWKEACEVANAFYKDSCSAMRDVKLYNYALGYFHALKRQPECPVERGEIGIVHAHVADLKK